MTTALIAFAIAHITSAVSVEKPATRFGELLPELSQLTESKLDASDELKTAFVVVRFDQTPVATALEEVATCLNAEWQKRGDTLMLVRKPSQSSTQSDLDKKVAEYFTKARAMVKWTSKDAEAFVKQNLDYAEKHTGNDISNWDEYNELSRGSVDRRLLSKILLSVGEQAITSLKTNSRVVYSTQPTAMQRPLSQSAFQALADYKREKQMHQDALAKLGVSENSDGGVYLQGLHPYYPEVDTASSLLLVIKKDANNLSLNVEIADGQGSTIMSSGDNISQYNMAPDKKPAPPLKVEGDFKPSKESEAIGRSLMENLGGRGEQSSPEDRALLMEYFRDLEKNELLRLAPSELMLQTAKALHKDLVAELPDASVMVIAYMTTQTGKKLNDIWSAMNGFQVWNVQDNEHALIVQPGREVLVGNFFIPRKEVSQFVRTVEKSGISIDALADLIGPFPITDLGAFVTQFSMSPFPEYRQQSMGTDTQALQLYSKLDPKSKSQARQSGYQVKIGSAPPPLQKALSTFVFFDKGKLEDAPPQETTEEYYSSGSLESTTLFPGGLPANGVVKFSLVKKSGYVINTTFEGGYQYSRVSSPESIASQVAWSEVDPQSRNGSTSKYGQIDYEELKVIVQLSEKAFATSTYRLLGKIDPSKLSGPDGLPEDVRKMIEKRRSEYREAYKNGFPGSPPERIKPLAAQNQRWASVVLN